ncbi:MAG: HD-GYP domain-containing protein [Bacillus sp. (in: Bacteria)]|nr:HD-GYP domain-containing protein [Bacillus sp. (in: firmicutes)]
METRLKFLLTYPLLFKFLFFITLVTVPILNSISTDFNSLYVLMVILFGVAFSKSSRWFLFLSCSLIVIIRQFVFVEYEQPLAFLIRLLVYLTVTFISSEVTKQLFEIKRQKTELIMVLAKSLDSRDTYTGNHSEDVANYSSLIAKEMGLSKTQCASIFIGGLLHDIGKIGIPESILTKASTLTAKEYEIIKQHPLIGYETIKHVTFLKKDEILDMVLHHHERYDGKGYPHRLKGEEIPLASRILAIADSFDAMTSKRNYRNALDLEAVMVEITSNKGTQFDPIIVDIFISMLKKDVTGTIFANHSDKKSG